MLIKRLAMSQDDSDNTLLPRCEEWAKLINTYLAHGDESALVSARDVVSDARVRKFLIGVVEENGANIDPENGYLLAEELESQEKYAAAAVLRILVLSSVVEFLDEPDALAEDRQEDLLNISFAGCQECIEIALGAGLSATAARYMFTMGKGLSKLRKWAFARSTCEEALHIYQELVPHEPVTYKPYVASVLISLGDIMCEQRAFSSAQLAYEEARDIYKEFAKKEPDAYKPLVAKTMEKLDTLYLKQKRQNTTTES